MKKIKIAYLACVLMLGSQASPLLASSACIAAIQQKQAVQNTWQLLETKDGVSCYWKIDKLGTGNGVFLRFVNNSGANATINWNVNIATDNVKSGKVVLTNGQTAEPNNQPAGSDLLAIRIPSGQPVITFTVSK